MPAQAQTRYRFQLLQYVPNLIAGERFNIGVFLYGETGEMLQARFASEFRRLRCHPLADLEYLETLRAEFEERRLLGEGFSAYVAELSRNLSTGLQISEPKTFRGGDPLAEVERLYQSYVATPSPPAAEGPEQPAAGTRAHLRRRMDETFRRYRLLSGPRGLRSEPEVNYGGPRLRFRFDYGYPPNGGAKYLHGVALRNDLNDAQKLCFVIERLRSISGSPVALTAVIDDALPQETRDLLAASDVAVHEASRLDELALAVRSELGL